MKKSHRSWFLSSKRLFLAEYILAEKASPFLKQRSYFLNQLVSEYERELAPFRLICHFVELLLNFGVQREATMISVLFRKASTKDMKISKEFFISNFPDSIDEPKYPQLPIYAH